MQMIEPDPRSLWSKYSKTTVVYTFKYYKKNMKIFLTLNFIEWLKIFYLQLSCSIQCSSFQFQKLIIIKPKWIPKSGGEHIKVPDV